MPNYLYDPRSRRYRNVESGQYVPAAQVRAAIDTLIDAQTAKARALSERLVNGEIHLAEWQAQMASELKALYVAVGVAARGGFANTTQSDYGFIGSLIKKQYQFLRAFAEQIASGQQPLDGTLVARAALYAQAARGLYETVAQWKAKQAGATQEKSVLHPADHCADCTGEAAKGWQPIGSLIPIGQRQCRTNCKCSFIYQ